MNPIRTKGDSPSNAEVSPAKASVSNMATLAPIVMI